MIAVKIRITLIMLIFKLLIMKKLLFIPTLLACLLNFGCQKDGVAPFKTSSTATAAKGNKNQTTVTTPTDTVASTTAVSTVPTDAVNVKDHGAAGDGVKDDTQAITNSIIYAKANGRHTVYFPEGTYSIQGQGITTGIIPLLNGVGLMGVSSAKSHIKLSGGRYNPVSIFYQAWWNEPAVSDVVIQGLDFDGNLANQTFDLLYQYCHALSINNGKNIEVKNCKFQSFRGDGVLFGDTFLSSPNLRMTSNVSVHNNEFYNIYREGAMFCTINGGTFYSNYLHGNGFFVAGVDIERHSVNESVLNVSVYNNTFDFRDGYGPVERGGPIVRYRRAVSMGFFYSGYTNQTADGLAGGHSIYGNTIYQGQIDCWGHTNVSITGNKFINTYEMIDGVGWLSAPAINVSDPSTTSGLTNITVSNNNINSAMGGNGILFNHYQGITASGNTITATKGDGINIYNATGLFDANIIQNIGSPTYRVNGIVVNGTCSGLVISNSQITDTNTGTNRGINYGIAIQSQNSGTVAPVIKYNTGTNLIGGIVSEFSGQLGYLVLSGNKSI